MNNEWFSADMSQRVVQMPCTCHCHCHCQCQSMNGPIVRPLLHQAAVSSQIERIHCSEVAVTRAVAGDISATRPNLQI